MYLYFKLILLYSLEAPFGLSVSHFLSEQGISPQVGITQNVQLALSLILLQLSNSLVFCELYQIL